MCVWLGVVPARQLVAPPSETGGTDIAMTGCCLVTEVQPRFSDVADWVSADAEPGRDAGDGLALRRSASLPKLGAGAEELDARCTERSGVGMRVSKRRRM